MTRLLALLAVALGGYLLSRQTRHERAAEARARAWTSEVSGDLTRWVREAERAISEALNGSGPAPAQRPG